MSSDQVPPIDSGQINKVTPLESTYPMTFSMIRPLETTTPLTHLELQSVNSTFENQVTVDLSANSLPRQRDDTPISPASVLDPKFGWVAPPELVLNCAMESLMPSPGRFMESNCEAPRFSLSENFFNGESNSTNSVLLPLVVENVNDRAFHVEKTVDVSSALATATLASAKANGKGVLSENPSSPVTHLPLTTGVVSPCEVSTSNKILSHKPPQGAWASPFKIASLFPAVEQAQAPTHKVREENQVSNNSLNEQWPALTAGNQSMRKRLPPVAKSTSLKSAATPDCISPLALDIIKASQEYPWAAKMKAVCNLHRVTNPVYMEDGTPKVNIPSHVLLEGIENQNQFVVGQFCRCKAPSGGLIHAVASRLWGRKCRIFTRKLEESSYLFHIPDEATRKWVIQRGIWHIDDCLMFVSPWSPAPVISLPEISTIPVWLTLQNIPYQLYSIKGIYWIASGIGEPMLTSKPWLDPTQMGEAKILVEVKLNKPFPQRVALEDNSGSITMVNVLYSWLPPKCSCCGHLGHKASHCLGANDPALGPVSVVAEEKNGEATVSANAPLQDGVTISKTVFPDLNTSLPKVGISITNPESGPAKGYTLGQKTDKSTKVDNVLPTATRSHVVDTPLPETVPILASPTKDAPLLPETISSLEDAFVEYETTVVRSATNLSSASVPSLVVNEQGSSPPNSASEMVSTFHISGKTSICISEENDDEYMGASNSFAVLEQNDFVNDDSTSQWSRGGRPIKPTQKVQEMIWTKGGRRGKRGRGRG